MWSWLRNPWWLPDRSTMSGSITFLRSATPDVVIDSLGSLWRAPQVLTRSETLAGYPGSHSARLGTADVWTFLLEDAGLTFLPHQADAQLGQTGLDVVTVSYTPLMTQPAYWQAGRLIARLHVEEDLPGDGAGAQPGWFQPHLERFGLAHQDFADDARRPTDVPVGVMDMMTDVFGFELTEAQAAAAMPTVLFGERAP